MTWTPDRPTKPGRYEVSRHPRLRGTNELHTIERSVALIPRWLIDGGDAVEPRALAIRMDSGSEGAWIRVSDAVFDGALWRPYVEPPDPFAEPVPQPVDRLPSDAELVKSAIRLMRTPRRRYSRTGSQRPPWSRVMMLFGHGSTYSRAICRAHGFDPDEVWMIEEARQ